MSLHEPVKPEHQEVSVSFAQLAFWERGNELHTVYKVEIRNIMLLETYHKVRKI